MFTLYRVSDAEAAHKIYPACLSGLGYGYALWHPEPHDTGEPQIGDVGYTREGAFVRLFNINTWAKEHAVASWEPKFDISEPLPLSVFCSDKRHAPIGPGRFPSRGVQEVEVEGGLTGGALFGTADLSAGYGCKEVQGALLVLKSHAYAESVYANRALEAHMLREHASWHAYARDAVGHRVAPQDVVLVSGWVKAPADWATAAFSNARSTHKLSLGAQVGQFFGFSVGASRVKSYTGPPMERRGAWYPDTARPDAPRNQCVFVKRYKVKERLGIVRVMVAGAGYDNPPTGHDDDAGDTRGSKLFAEAEDPQLDPLDLLLEYILEISEAQFALARDEDIQGILGGDIYPTDFSTYLRVRQPPVLVDDACGRISVSHMLDREQAKMKHRRITAPDLARWPNISAEGCEDVSSGRANLPTPQKQRSRELSNFAFLRFARADGNTRSPLLFALSPDGSLIAASLGVMQITILRASDGMKLNALADLDRRHMGSLTALTFSSDGRRLASASKDKAVIVWDVAYGISLLCLEGHEAFPTAVAFAPQNKYLASGAGDGTIIFWDLSSGTQLHRYAGGVPVRRLIFDASGSQLAAVLKNKVVLLEIGAGAPRERATITLYPDREYPTAYFSPDSDRILVVTPRVSASLHATDSGRLLLSAGERSQASIFSALLPRQVQQNKHTITSAALSPDGQTIASVSGDRESPAMVVQDAQSGDVLFKAAVDTAGSAIAFSPDGTLLATTRDPMTVMVLNARSGELVALLHEMAERPITEIKFLPDSRRMLFAGLTGAIGLVNVGDTLRIR
ncbi:WD40 repeat domain-containing protein [Phanerochaete sordida]|uniref:WD40 repeat domain-containing protein n=1 Tax=Phanerochaete sordida TaxID=48140 RepID=A0A9P3GG44_9APHY|nr:WD40 repeat domain-containing protein [Phanerochaete sordida]